MGIIPHAEQQTSGYGVVVTYLLPKQLSRVRISLAAQKKKLSPKVRAFLFPRPAYTLFKQLHIGMNLPFQNYLELSFYVILFLLPLFGAVVNLFLPNSEVNMSNTPDLKAINQAILEITLTAIEGGHQLEEFSLKSNGNYEASCQLCGQPVIINFLGVPYNTLEPICRAKQDPPHL